MGYKLGYHILVLPNQVLLNNSVLTNEVLLYYIMHMKKALMTHSVSSSSKIIHTYVHIVVDPGGGSVPSPPV